MCEYEEGEMKERVVREWWKIKVRMSGFVVRRERMEKEKRERIKERKERKRR